MKRKKILVIAPHADDEILGVGGYLWHESQKGSEIRIVYCAVGGNSVRQDAQERYAELTQVCSFMFAKPHVLFWGKDAELDIVSSREIIGKIDAILDEYKPDEVFINCKSHHQDHRKVYECAMASMRQREGFVPKMVALYEYPCLEPGEVVEGGRWYHCIDDSIKDKCSLLSLYKSQIRNAPSPINESGVMSLASMRGRECGVEYAELFYIQKMMS